MPARCALCGRRILLVEEVKRKAQHPEHQLFREAIIKRAFLFAFESDDGTLLRRINENAALHVLHVLSVLYRDVKSGANYTDLRLELILTNLE